jgi:transcriptional regulator with XRE-family HTH domain
VETEIGSTLREARIRRHIDLIEIEEKTKIRVRYLRALENEEWDVLPGPTYTRSFIRTYASFLGLDGERLADDFRRMQDEALIAEGGGRDPRPLPPRPIREPRERRLGGGVIAAAAALVLIASLVAIGLTIGDDSGSPAKQANGNLKPAGKKGQSTPAHKHPGVSIKVTATSEVWVCALAANGTAVVDGQILQAGASEGPFRSAKFDLAFGNGGVDLEVDGKPFKVQDTPSPVGYEVTGKGTRVLPPGTRPDCT